MLLCDCCCSVLLTQTDGRQLHVNTGSHDIVIDHIWSNQRMGGDLQKGHFPNISASDTYSVTGEDFPAAAKAIMEQAGPRHLRLPLKADDGYETTVWSNTRTGRSAARSQWRRPRRKTPRVSAAHGPALKQTFSC